MNKKRKMFNNAIFYTAERKSGRFWYEKENGKKNQININELTHKRNEYKSESLKVNSLEDEIKDYPKYFGCKKMKREKL